MSFLTLNGVNVPVALGSLKVEPVEVGERLQAFDGSPIVSRRRVKQKLAFETPALSAEEANALRGLVLGLGHAFPFSDVYSCKGLGPSASSGYSLGAGGVYGSRLSLGAGGAVTWNTAAGNPWTVLAWRKVGGVWTHYLVRSFDTTQPWINGVQTAESTAPWLVVDADGNLSLEDTGEFDDAVILPFQIPEAWVAGLYAFHSARAWSTLPRVVIGGAFGALTAVGAVKSVDYVPARVAGGWGQRLSVEIEEV